MWAKAKSNTGTPLPKFDKIRGDIPTRTTSLTQHVAVVSGALGKSRAQVIADKWTSLGVFVQVEEKVDEVESITVDFTVVTVASVGIVSGFVGVCAASVDENKTTPLRSAARCRINALRSR